MTYAQFPAQRPDGREITAREHSRLGLEVNAHGSGGRKGSDSFSFVADALRGGPWGRASGL